MRMLKGMRGDTLTGPVEPKPSGWTFPPAHSADEKGVVGAGAHLVARREQGGGVQVALQVSRRA